VGLSLPARGGPAVPCGRADGSLCVAALLFDLGGTLDADGRGWAERFAALWREERPGLDAEQLGTALAEGEQAVLRHPHAGGLGLADMVALHVSAHGHRLGAMEAARAVGRRFLAGTAASLSGRRPLLEALAARVPLGVVSNGCGNTAVLLREAGLADLFRVVVDSAAAGVWKPDPAIFAPALAALGIAAGEVAMVGDRLDRDVQAASAAGLRTVWVSGGRPLDPGDPLSGRVDTVVASVEELRPAATA